MKEELIAKIGNIPRDNHENVWGDYDRILVLFVRRDNEKSVKEFNTIYFLMSRDDLPFSLQPIPREQAEKHMQDAWMISAKEITIPSP